MESGEGSDTPTVASGAVRRTRIMRAIPLAMLAKASGLEPFDHLSTARFEKRLRQRAARRLGLSPEQFVEEDSELDLLLGSEFPSSTLITLSGAVCQSDALRRVLDASFWRELSEELTFGRQSDVLCRSVMHADAELRQRIKPLKHEGTVSDFVEAIRADGVSCWECWLAQRSRATRICLTYIVPDLEAVDDARAAQLKGPEAEARGAIFSGILEDRSEEEGRSEEIEHAMAG